MTLLEAIDPLISVELEAVVRIILAAILGAALGIERSLAGKHAGMRTYALVALGSSLFIVAGDLLTLLSYGPGLDPSRMAAAVVIGIGFIGSGLALIRNGEERGGELTTAAGIWVAAGIGTAVGFGFYVLGIAATVLSLLIFTLLMRFEGGLRGRYKGMTE